MSIMYCEYCDRMIDTDFQAEHFILEADGMTIKACTAEVTDNPYLNRCLACGGLNMDNLGETICASCEVSHESGEVHQ